MPKLPPGGCIQNSYSGVPPQVALPVSVTVGPGLVAGGLNDSVPPVHGGAPPVSV